MQARYEIMCVRCDGHIGHVSHGYDNGFPTEEHHCVNSCALIFCAKGDGTAISPTYDRFVRTLAGGSA